MRADGRGAASMDHDATPSASISSSASSPGTGRVATDGRALGCVGADCRRGSDRSRSVLSRSASRCVEARCGFHAGEPRCDVGLVRRWSALTVCVRCGRCRRASCRAQPRRHVASRRSWRASSLASGDAAGRGATADVAMSPRSLLAGARRVVEHLAPRPWRLARQSRDVAFKRSAGCCLWLHAEPPVVASAASCPSDGLGRWLPIWSRVGERRCL